MRAHGPGTLVVSEVDEAFFDEESPVAAVSFELHDGALTVVIGFLVDHYDDEER